ncbi:LysR family transcriptional regulator [Ensifer sp. MPMI2T]|nr:LysR family transcriptional regulator [Ensifer sp. MPMI2T]
MEIIAPAPLPTLELNVLRTFEAVADAGSFTLAASAVSRTPSAVSMQIKKMEEELGVDLFHRNPQAVALTQHGKTLLSYAKRMIALNNEAASRFIKPDTALVVRLGAPDDIAGLMLPKILKSLCETWPQLSVELTVQSLASISRAIQTGRLDLGFYNARHAGSAEKLVTENLVWVARKTGIAHLRKPLPVAVRNSGCIWRADALRALSKRGIAFRIAHSSASPFSQLTVIRADLAVAPLSRALVQRDMTVLGERDGVPDLGTYDVGLKVARDVTGLLAEVAEFVGTKVAERYRQPSPIGVRTTPFHSA